MIACLLPTPTPSPQGWRTYFVEIIYPPKGHGFCQSCTTQVYVAPNKRSIDALHNLEDIAYPVNPPPQRALDASMSGAYPDDLPLAPVQRCGDDSCRPEDTETLAR